MNLNLGWTYYFMGVLISSSVFPIAISILWARATAAGMMAGAIGGCLSGMSCWLITASTYEGGLGADVFVQNSGKVSFT